MLARLTAIAPVAAVYVLGLAAPGTAQAQVLRLGSQFQVNAYTTSIQSRPVVKNGSDADFLVVWQSNGSAGTDGDGTSIQAQRIDKKGAPRRGSEATATTAFLVG